MTNELFTRASVEDRTVARTDEASFAGRLDSVQTALSQVWCELLELERIDIHDNFFSLGGHSLLAMRVVLRLQAVCGIRVPVSAVFEHPTIASLSRVVCQRSQADSVPLHCGPDVGTDMAQERAGLLVTSCAQRGLWFQEQLGNNGGAYVLPEVWRVRGPLQVKALLTSLTTLVRRHPALRTRFLMVGDLPVRVIDEPRPVDLQIVDLRQLSGPIQQSEVDRLAFEEASRPFDLSRDLLLRTKMAVLEDEHHILFVTTHHIASDARSQQILRQEIGALYRHLVRREHSQIDVPQAHSVDQMRLSPSRERDLRQYWRAQLQDMPPLELPSDCERPARFSYRGAEHRFSISTDLTARVRRLADEHEVTLQIVLLAVYQVLLARLSGQMDFGVATPVAETSGVESARLIGLLVNVLITRADLSGDPDFIDLLARVRRTWLSAYDHCDLPFDAVVAELLPSRDLGRAPLAQAMFQFVPFDDGVPNLEGLDVTRVRYPGRCVRFDLELSVWKEGAGLCAALGYSTDVFEPSAGARLAGYYLTLLESVVANPHRDVSKLPILGSAEQKQQLVVWSGASDVTPVNANDCVHRQFALQAAQTSELTAVAFGETKLTYRQLDERANQLAHYLLELGVQHEEPVGILLERSAETVVAMLAALKADAAYVPLDVRQPEDRLAFIVADAGVRTLITNGTPPLPMQHCVQRIVRMAENAAWATHESSAPRSTAQPLDLAYIMYTSGSTGRPKGVAVTHQGIVRLVRNTNYAQLSSYDRVAQGANTSFDAATFEIWGALLNGAQLVGVSTEKLLSPHDLGRTIADGDITALFLTPALFCQLAAEDPAIFAPLRYLVIGGDVLDPRTVRTVLAAGAPLHLINGYGPTENTTFSACFDCVGAPGSLTSIPIGRPVSNSTCYVVDRHGALLPRGAIGELLVGGKGLARGYINRPELTAERFVSHPFSRGERLYRTGDRARWRSDGTLAFEGRIDRQIKLRGHRIEPDEIECALREHEAVEQVIVIAEDRAGERRLIAYWVPRTECGPVSADALSAHLRRFLPEYMVPALFVQLTAFPLTANGKINVSALPVPRGVPIKASKETLSALESQVAGIWRRVLNDDCIGIHDNFFASGGTSLLAVQVAARLREDLDCPVSIGDLFSFPTIARLSHALEARSLPGGASGRLVVIRQGDRKPPIIFPPDIAGDVAVFDGIRAGMPPDQPVYALEDRSHNPRARSMEAMAAEYCKAVRRRWPHDIIHLAGYSFSGILAYEMARQLIADGQPIGLLAIIDTGPSHLSREGAMEPIRALWAFMSNVPRWIHEDLIRASWDEAPVRLRRSTSNLAKQLFTLGRSHFRPAATDLFDVTGWTKSQRAQVDLNLRALERFTYRPYPGRLFLFRASTRPLFQSLTRDLGWGAIARELQIVHVPGNHETITRCPRVGMLSAALNAALLESSGQPSAAVPVHKAGGMCETA